MKRELSFLLATISLAANAQLSGTYTVGGASPDYPSLVAAIYNLVIQGATGNVTFNIRPGTYVGQYSLGAIPGSPGFITIRSESGNASDVMLAYDAQSTTDNFIFRVEGTDGVVLQALTLRPTDPFFARAVVFEGDIQGLQINDCVVQGSADPDQNSGFERTLLWCDQNNAGSTDNPQDVMVLDNTFLYGYEAINFNFEGDSGNRSQGLIITGNTCTDQYATGITITNAVGQIGDNLITTDGGIFYVGIRTNYFDGGSQIRRNQVRAFATTGGCNGIECGNTQFTTGNMISNNMIYCNAPGDVWGLAVYNLWDMKIVHNSVLIGAGNEFQSYAFYHLSGFPDGQDALVRNNIFANAAGGHAYNVDVAGNVAVEDHNCLFTTGPNLSEVGSGFYSTLAAHQAGTGMGAGDTDVDPVFPLQPDLHLNGCTSDLAGQYFFVTASDIDGDARGNPVCDMGADEFTFSGSLFIAVDLVAGDLPYTLTAPNGLEHNWNTGATTQSITVDSTDIYGCTFTDPNGCEYTIYYAVTVDFSTGMPQIEQASFAIRPNPAVETLSVTGLTGAAPYTVHDGNGRAVLQGSLRGASTIDVRGLPAGLYLLRVPTGTRRR
jgi:hypothetical protein